MHNNINIKDENFEVLVYFKRLNVQVVTKSGIEIIEREKSVNMDAC